MHSTSHRLALVTKVAAIHALTSGIINLAIYWLSQSSNFSVAHPMRDLLLPWAIGVNISATTLIILFSNLLGWKRCLVSVVVLDLLSSLLPFALISCLAIQKEAARKDLFGLIYTVFTFSKCFLLTWYAFVNVTEGAEISVRVWVLTVTLLIYAAITPWAALGAWPDGDEPHYLILTHSLVSDQDFNLENNYRKGDYKSFYPPDLPREDHHTVVNRYGEEVPVHDVGISVLLIPGYAVAGRIGAMIMLNLIGAIVALGLYVLSLQIGATQRGALGAWALFAFTSPLIVYSSQIFPEIAGAACSVWAIIGFTKIIKANRYRLLILVGFLLSLLPWFSTRFWEIVLPLFSIIALYILMQFRVNNWSRGLKNLSMLTLPIVLSLGIFAIFGLRYFNSILPNAGYFVLASESARPSPFAFNHIGLLGIFFDRAYGLLTTAPVYIVALVGGWAFLRQGLKHQTWVKITILVVSVFCTLLAGINQYWYGGWCPPSRYLVSTIPIWAPLASLVISNSKSTWAVAPLAAWSLLIAVAYSAFPLTRYTFWDVNTGALSKFIYKHIGLDYGVVFPSFIRAGSVDYLLTALWAGIAIICIWLLNKTSNRSSIALREADMSGSGLERLCELVNPTKYSNPDWMRIHRELESYSFDKHVFSLDGSNVYRKGWEWTQAAYGLHRLGMINPDYVALGVGAGRECLIFWLADHLKKVIATDLYGNEMWSTQGGKEADADILLNPQNYCPRTLSKNNIVFLSMDGTNLCFDDNSFDIVWSMSSIEHFGGHEQASKSMQEIARVTRPGGVIAIATEYLLLDEYTHLEYFNTTDLFKYIVHANSNLELIEPINFSLPPNEYLIDSVIVPHGADRCRRHVVLNDGQVQWTSVMLFFRKI